MIHPLLRLIGTKPELLAEHLAGYGELLAAQASEAAVLLRLRALLAGAVLVGGGVGLCLAGMAALLAAAIPLAQMPVPVLLLVVPALPLLVAAACGWVLWRQPPAWRMDLLREQLLADAALLQELKTA